MERHHDGQHWNDDEHVDAAGREAPVDRPVPGRVPVPAAAVAVGDAGHPVGLASIFGRSGETQQAARNFLSTLPPSVSETLNFLPSSSIDFCGWTIFADSDYADTNSLAISSDEMAWSRNFGGTAGFIRLITR